LVPTQSGGVPIPPGVLSQIQSSILGQVFGGAATYITFLTAGIVCSVILFEMAFGGTDIVLDRQFGFLNTLLTAPISRASIYFGGVFQGLAKAMSQALIAFSIALIIPGGLVLARGFGILNLLGVFASFGLLAFAFSCIFTAIALSMKSIDSLIAVVNFIAFPVTFVSTALFPLASFPAWLRPFAEANPITRASDAARLLIVNGTLSSSQFGALAIDMAYLFAFVIILGGLGYLIARRSLRPE
jgi:ABC-2 type transport system permease protein